MPHSIMLNLVFSIVLILSNFNGFTNCQHQQTIRSFSVSDPTWTPNRDQILISPNSTFAAGFLASSSSPHLYTFSVWYHNLSSRTNMTTVVWSVHDTDRFPVNISASLVIKPSGELSLSAVPSGRNLWPSAPVSNKTALELRESGNLVFGDWESFDFPTNTFLPTQNITNATVLSTKNGRFLFLDSRQLVYKNRSGSYWDGGNAFVMLDSEGRISQRNSASIISSDIGDPRSRRLTLDEDGNLRLYSFDPELGQWALVWRAVENLCRIRGTCGDYAICSYEPSDTFTTCDCPPGFRKVSDACQRNVEIKEYPSSKFISLDYVSFVAGTNHTNFPVSTFSDCQNRCLSNQSCEGYQFRYDGSFNACVLLLGTLRDGLWSPDNENVLFLRLDKAEAGNETRYIGMTSLMETSCPVRIKLPTPPEETSETTRNVVIISTLFAAELLSGAFFFWTFLKKYTKYRDMARTFGLEVIPGGGPKRFSYVELRDATNGFSDAIGKGGFGIVYKGTLSDGRVVAIKSLKNIAGGDPDFWAEVTIIARMHHLNLVRLWGFCTDKDRRLLVYEYVPNGSLDKFLFQPGMPVLDWNIRYRIALGVARAIAYLHEECLEWVLHCDIKPENILLGDDFCPKVSDFGLAKLKKKEDMVSKSRIRGTRGYLAPEWVRPEAITSKSDVYSFGLVLLEIVTGKRNFDQENSNLESSEWYFPSWAYDQVYDEMNVDDILDSRIKNTYDSHAHFDMVNRMLKTAMSCIQDRAENRPTMGKVAKMLEGTVEITQPKKPSTYVI